MGRIGDFRGSCFGNAGNSNSFHRRTARRWSRVACVRGANAHSARPTKPNYIQSTEARNYVSAPHQTESLTPRTLRAGEPPTRGTRGKTGSRSWKHWRVPSEPYAVCWQATRQAKYDTQARGREKKMRLQHRNLAPGGCLSSLSVE